MILREYQEDLIRQLRGSATLKKICLVLGCGGGKTVLQAELMKRCMEKDNKALYLVHRKELITQVLNTLIKHGVNVNYHSIQTVQGFKPPPWQPTLIITDEAHHCGARSYRKIYDQYPDVLHIGFTATPDRAAGDLGEIFKKLVFGPKTKWLIEHKFLSPYTLYSVTLADAKNIKVRRGDYDGQELAELMEHKYIYGRTVANWQKIADGKKTIVYCASIKASVATAEQFKLAGIAAEHLDGKTPKTIREQVVQDFRDGKIQVLCNVDLFGEGFDVPDCECVVLLRPTKSLTLYIQQSMRSMRYQEGKVAIIIDHVCNWVEHGRPDDDREWSLDGKKKKKEKSECSIKTCPECFAVIESGLRECPYCGAALIAPEEAEKITIDYDLHEIAPSLGIAESFKEPKDCKTWEELTELAKAKGYKPGWAWYQAKRLGIHVPAKTNWVYHKVFRK